MNRHPFRWESLAAGLFFLGVVGAWAVWEQDLFTSRQLTLLSSGVLILLGLIGVAVTLRSSRPASTPSPVPHPVPEGPDDEAADPQS